MIILPNERDFFVNLFQNTAKKYPQQVAISFNEQYITYEELDKKSDAVAQYLFAHSLKSQQVVGILLERSPEIIISILAILKCGAIYLPMDPGYPASRISFMANDAQSKFIISSKKIIEKHSFDNEAVLIEDIFAARDEQISLPQISYSENDIAYVLYTSGSTGNPKGAKVTHGNLVHFLNGMQQIFRVVPDDKFLSVSSVSFDASCFDYYLSLVNGATLVLTDNETARDGNLLLQAIIKNKVTIMLATPVTYKLMLQARWDSHLQVTILSAGEPLLPGLAKELLPKVKALYNVYGPTETTVICILTKITDYNDITIGEPIEGTPIYFLDSALKKVAAGNEGEICIGGNGVSLGYLNRDTLNKEKFISDPFTKNDGKKLYRSGDLGRLRNDGKIEYLGRIDDQVKIRGYRIELGEIEHRISLHKKVKEVAVLAKTDGIGEKRLVAYMVPKNGTENKADFIAAVKNELSTILPVFMIPEQFICMDQFPISPNGKIDKKQLPDISNERPELQVLYKAPVTLIEKNIAAVWSEVLRIDKIGVDDNFFELGGNSLLAQKSIGLLNEKGPYKIPITKLYQYPTIAGLQNFITGDITNKKNRATPLFNKQVTKQESIAIIGMECNFPGAATVEAFWKVLVEGKETTSFFTNEELDPQIPASVKEDPLYVKARGVLNGVEDFDAGFFGINPKLAALMDPQHRLFLETSRNLLEKTGYLPLANRVTLGNEKNNYVTGVFVGCNTNTYFNNNVIWHKEEMELQGTVPVSSVSDKDYISSRVAYQLNLNGPAVNINTACSTSLVAVGQAVDSLRNGQCDIAIAGGASVTVPVNSGHLYQEGSMLSVDGHCRPFDANATGTVFSDGVGAVLLKRLDDAIRDGDTIYAVVKGVGVNNDGGNKGSFTAPNAEGQAAAIAMAMHDANITPLQVSYIEAHGTATPLGDPIEIEGLRLAFGEQEKKQYCSIGSLKSNMGHLTHAAGVAGLIKTTLSLYYKKLPPSIYFSTPNPLINFANSPFIVNDTLKNWEVVGKRIAGVSSFGVGGTNSHIIIEEFIGEDKKNTIPDNENIPQLITWSAREKQSFDGYKEKLQEFVKTHPDATAVGIAYTLQTTRQDFSYRGFLIADNKSLQEQLQQNDIIAGNINIVKEKDNQVVFLFPGQGSQYINMGKELYLHEKIYKNAIDTCAEILLKETGEDIRAVLFPQIADEVATEKIKNTKYAQPCIFITSYALAQLYINWGIQPVAFAGHSIGEFVAAHLAGIFSLHDVLKIIAVRARLISELPRGSMLSVRTASSNLESLLPKDISIAAINAPQLAVVSGNETAIESFSQTLTSQNIPNKALRTSHAFHSQMIAPIVASLEAVIASVKKNVPKIPILSTVTGKWLKDDEATSAYYWAQQARDPVRFSDAISTMENDLHPLFLETGPGTTATVFAKQHVSVVATRAIAALDTHAQSAGELIATKNALGKLWLQGATINWKNTYHHVPQILHDLPTYYYNKQRLWVKGPEKQQPVMLLPNQEPTSKLSTNHKQEKLERKEILIDKIKDIIEAASGISVANANPMLNFTELGLDSLLLTQLTASLKKEFNIVATFRQLSEEYDSLDKLAAFYDANLPDTAYKNATVTPDVNNTGTVAATYINNPPVPGNMLGLITQQLQLLTQQVALLQGGNGSSSLQNTISKGNVYVNGSPENNSVELTADEKLEFKKPFGATARIEKQRTDINPTQQQYLSQLIKSYNEKTKASKEYTQQHRPQMADPRVVSGFKPVLKEAVYSIVIKKSKGCYLWDIDDNKYVDALNGFGSNFLGYQADVLKTAIQQQIEDGYEIGPQHVLAGEVADLICEMTGAERVGLCNTGSEAILGAMRIARTVTSKNIIVAFTGSYHGIIDEVLVRGSKKLKTYPAAPGILADNVQNMLILEYGTSESLQIIKERAAEIAGVLVEPVQSRRPEFQPVPFLKELRQLTEKSDIALIFDEVITGFRSHPGGTQALFDIKADIATYGKVVGGGLSIGVIGGSKKFMDALDGGFWQYGDASIPEVGVTYFAGTFVRHPLALATAKATLRYLKAQGPDLQLQLNQKTEALAARLNTLAEVLRVPIYVVYFSSLWKIKFKEEYAYYELLFLLMRKKSIHIWDGFPCFLTTAHTQEDLDAIVDAFEESIKELIEANFIPQHPPVKNINNYFFDYSNPPAPGARLGKDKDGNPAWFIQDEKNPGKYLQVNK